MQPAIFMDRDGVIIENQPDYVRSWQDVHIYPHALQALARASSSPYRLVIVTNQAGIGRGLISRPVADEINRRLLEIIQEAGGRIDGVYLCPHTKEDGCACRKPAPGMLLQAAHELDLDLKRSWIIGDALSDLQAGQAAGLKHAILVRTGLGANQAQAPEAKGLKPFSVCDSLKTALDWILGQS